MSSDQLNLRLKPELIKQLERDAERYGLKKNTIAAEIIETYYEHWHKLQEEIFCLRQEHLKLIGKENRNRLSETKETSSF